MLVSRFHFLSLTLTFHTFDQTNHPRYLSPSLTSLYRSPRRMSISSYTNNFISHAYSHFISLYLAFRSLMPLLFSKSIPNLPKQTTLATPTSCLRPWSYVSDDVLPTFWHIVYWTSQVLTW